MTTIMILNASGRRQVDTCLDIFGLDWNSIQTFIEIEESAENLGADFVKKYGIEWETGTRSARGDMQMITLRPEYFDFEEIES